MAKAKMTVVDLEKRVSALENTLARLLVAGAKPAGAMEYPALAALGEISVAQADVIDTVKKIRKQS